MLRDGLDQLAGMARGRRVPHRRPTPTSRSSGWRWSCPGYYLLSFEPQPGDRDGKPHKINIDVRRKDLTLRSRREFSVGAAGSRADRGHGLETLRAPLLASDIPLKLTTYTFQDPESAKLQDHPRGRHRSVAEPATSKLSLGYLMFDDKGKLVTSQLEKAVDGPIDPQTQDAEVRRRGRRAAGHLHAQGRGGRRQRQARQRRAHLHARGSTASASCTSPTC